MKHCLIVFFIFFLVLGSFSLMAQDEEKGSVGLLVGGSSEVKNDFDTEASRAVFGLDFTVSPFEGKPLYLGGSVVLNKPRKEFFSLEGFPFQATTGFYLVDFNVGAKKKFREGLLTPFVEGGVGFLGNRLSLCSGFVGCFSENNFDFSQHLGFGLRSYLGEERKFFVGGKTVFYKVSGDTVNAVLGEVGIIFSKP